jgi:hypothetical protein
MVQVVVADGAEDEDNRFRVARDRLSIQPA